MVLCCFLYLTICIKGEFQALRLGRHDSHPLELPSLPGFAPASPPSPKAAAVVVEDDAPVRSRRRAAAEDAFGTLPPALPRLEYTARTAFRGGRFTVDAPLSVRASFRGSNVFAGLKQLCEAGLADTPLPLHVQRATASAQSVFTLSDADF